MPTAFGPQLIGETDKTLNALLRRVLDGTGLDEPRWVTMRLAEQIDGAGGAAGLAAEVADRAHFADASQLVEELTGRGLLVAGSPTTAGRQMIADVQTAIAQQAAPIWDGFPPDDVAATARVLNEIVVRARAVLATSPASSA